MRILEPNRDKYNKKRGRRPECFFCDAHTIKKQECTIFPFNHWRVLVNQYPYMDGNVMLVPKRHITTLQEISDDEWNEFSAALLKVQSKLQHIFHTESFNIGLNIGPESGRSIPHLHWQIIPRTLKNHTVIDTVADIQSITLDPERLRIKLSKR